ncbi:MAG: 3-deoxy-manno-octulosonate cytidylyltransferase [Bacteroidales bacterium]
MQAIGIIPARYASTRFPGKPLVNIKGRSMIQRVYEQATQCQALKEVLVATDDQRIFDHVSTFGKAVMTRSDHPSGTDRCQEALQRFNPGNTYTGNDIVVNIQGDEPFIDPAQIQQLVSGFSDPERQIISLMKEIRCQTDIHNPNVVKVVCGQSGNALYFSRSPIPFIRGESSASTPPQTYFKHLGMYGYRIRTLEEIVALPAGKLEQLESLEQLRWLEYGYPIFMEITELENTSIDTPEDLERIQANPDKTT